MTARKVRALIRTHLKTRQLALLVHLDDERRLAGAASAAGLTQPAASKMLREIETALDVKLFERHTRGVVPTWYGEILVRHARLMLSELEIAQDEIAALKSGLSGRAAIGTIMNPSTNLVPKAIARMKQRYPGIFVRVELDASRPLLEKLRQGHLDMLIARALDSRDVEALSYEPLADDEPHAVIAGAQHPLASRKGLQLEDLIEQPWILPAVGSFARDKLETLFVQRGLPFPTNIVETFSLPVITTLLQETNMIVPLPEETVQSACTAGVLKILLKKLPLEIGPFGIITRRGYTLSPGAQVMLAALRETAVQMYPAATAVTR